MNPPRSDDHWLDRLAVGLTRREAVKGALAASVLTLPFGSARAFAANPGGTGAHDCAKGCLFMSHVRGAQRHGACSEVAEQHKWSTIIASLWINPVFLAPGVAGTAAAAGRCHDQALLAQKAESYDCLLPNCPGFDPNAAGGPCEACNQAGGKCCPWAGSPTGYGCCANDPNICCDPANLCKTC